MSERRGVRGARPEKDPNWMEVVFLELELNFDGTGDDDSGRNRMQCGRVGGGILVGSANRRDVMLQHEEEDEHVEAKVAIFPSLDSSLPFVCDSLKSTKLCSFWGCLRRRRRR